MNAVGIVQGVVQYTYKCDLIISCGRYIYHNDNGETEFYSLPPIPLRGIQRLMTHHPLLQRLTRAGIHHVCRLSTDDLIVIGFGGTYMFRKNSGWHHISAVIGRRPLVLTTTPDGIFYYGEYRSNPERSPVSVWRSSDGSVAWHPAWTFNNIRHIHGVFLDPYTNLKWVTTGDADVESGIWVTYDDFVHLDMIVGGTQQYRAIQLLFTDHFVYFGSDTPLEENHIYRMERQTGKIDVLQSVSGPVFYGCKVGDNLFFSTAVEPSNVNKSKYACLWGSQDGDKWKCIARFRKDIWPMKLFRYGQILFPAGDNQTGKLWFTPFATEYDQTVQCIDVQKIDWD